MLTTSQHIATSSSSRICDKMALARSSFTESAFPRADGVAIAASQTKIIRIRAKLFATGCGNKKIVFQPQASATFPVHAGLNGKHHARTHGAGSSLMGIRRFMSARTHPMSHWMRWLAGVTGDRNSLSQDAVNVAKRRAIANTRDRLEEHTSELQSHSDLVCRLLLEKKKKL